MKILRVFVVCIFAACAVGPRYKKPDMQVPSQYKGSANSDLWKTAQPEDELSRGKWWELFGDPNLNSLEERVNVSNQTLKIAEAQYREARALVRVDRSGFFPTVTTNPSVTVLQSSRNRSV